MRPKHVLSVLLLGLLGACMEAPSTPLAPSDPSLIIGGEPDAGRHPYVGLLFLGTGGGLICTGALLSADVVLTSAHCTIGATTAYFWPSENPWPTLPTLQGSYSGTPYTFEGFGSRQSTPAVSAWLERDYGIVVLNSPVPTSIVSTYATLPTAGYVDGLGQMTTVGLVGYGVEEPIRGASPPSGTRRYVRLYAEAVLVGGNFVNSENVIRLSANTAQGKGSTCFGDSGGPVLIGNTVIGVVSYGPEQNCRSVWFASRVDTPAALAWIGGFLD